MHGWGQYLCNYVDTEKYDVRNISVSGITSAELLGYSFATAERYGKSGDILLLAVGINDYTKQNSTNPDPSDYKANLTEMIRRAKAKGMTVYLVKQHGESSDPFKYPLPANRWFGDVMDELAQSGLQTRGFGEEVYLEPLFDRAERLTNPALEYLNALEHGTHIEELIERCAALNVRVHNLII